MTIGEISAATGIPESTLRYYEKNELIRVGRDKNGRRVYEDGDITWIAFIKKLKDTGMHIKDIKRYSALRYKGDSTMRERLAMLERHSKYVEEQCAKWAKYSQNLDDKMNFYRAAIRKLEKKEA